jgi:hypothetical protein
MNSLLIKLWTVFFEIPTPFSTHYLNNERGSLRIYKDVQEKKFSMEFWYISCTNSLFYIQYNLADLKK